MVVDNFEKEKNLDRFLFNMPLVCGIILFAGLLIYGICNVLKITADNIPFSIAVNTLTLPLLGGLILLGAGYLCTVNFKRKARKAAVLSVNTEELSFSVDGKLYYFSDLMPEFDMAVSGNTRFLYWYDLTLYLKDGSALKFTLPQSIGISFTKNYLKKYSKPSASMKLCGIQF